LYPQNPLITLSFDEENIQPGRPSVITVNSEKPPFLNELDSAAFLVHDCHYRQVSLSGEQIAAFLSQLLLRLAHRHAIIWVDFYHGEFVK
jgi:hypothetical protein